MTTKAADFKAKLMNISNFGNELATDLAELYDAGKLELFDTPVEDNFKAVGEIYASIHSVNWKCALPSLLTISYKKVSSAKRKIADLFPDVDIKIINELYNENCQIYYITEEQVIHIYNNLLDIFNNEITWDIFKPAILLGDAYEVEIRLEVAADAVAYDKETIYKAIVNGYLFDPNADPIKAIVFLKNNYYSKDQISKLITETEFLMLYKSNFYIEKPSEKSIRISKMKKILRKIKN